MSDGNQRKTLASWWRPSLGMNFRPTNRAKKDVLCAASYFGKLEDGWYSLLITGCTNAMKWFGAAGVWFQRIGKRWSDTHQLLQLIPISLSFPCFMACHFFFKIAYFLQQRRLSRLGRKCALLGGEDFSIHFPESVAKFRKVADFDQFLNALPSSIQWRHDGIEPSRHDVRS
jgi:hypothetical protein